MMKDMIERRRMLIRCLLSSTVALSGILFASSGHAQTASAAAPTRAAAPAQSGLAEIVVTAQKREQHLQDVPIAITALTQEALRSNRVQSVNDLSGLAPNLTTRQAGASGIASFSMRGVNSYGVVPGSDKEISIYIDGVYIGSPRASIFDLPDIARVEILRGPQGTLFGRNATAGAISITTRDPKGRFGFRQEVSVGNYGYVRTRTTVDLPTVGPFSAYFTYMHNEKRGDVRNRGAGTTWDRTASPTGYGVLTSPKYLGGKNANTWFAVVRFEPSDSFNTTYKFDYATDHFTPQAEGLIGLNPNALGPTVAQLLGPVFAASSPTIDNSAKRPEAVNNSWSTPGFQRVQGHSLTSNLRATASLSFKNIAAYRKSFVTVNSQLDGAGGLFYPFPPTAGAPFILTAGENQANDEQFSDEFQANYSNHLVTLTVGGLYFWQKSRVGGPLNMTNTVTFSPLPGGVIPTGKAGESHVRATSLAAYAQAELHVTGQLDIVGGIRETHDHKTGDFHYVGSYTAGGVPVGATESTLPFDYKKTKPNFSIGVDYKLNRDILLYGKYSTAFVSGGSVGGVNFDPETAKSWEAGVKADLLDRRLRANLALFTTKYTGIQTAQSGQNVGQPMLSTVIIPLGDGRAKGFELELTAAPVDGLTLSASTGYTDVKYSNVNPIILKSVNGGPYAPLLIPKWTANLSAEYHTQPLFGDASLMFRVDANWKDKMQVLTDGQVAQSPSFGVLKYIPSTYIVNGRVALQKLKLGPLDGEVAIWARNITNDRTPVYSLDFAGYVYSATFQPARAFGADFIVNF